MEVRHLVIGGAEVRAAGDFSIVGKALSYNVLSPTGNLGPGKAERIAPGCFAATLKSADDVKCLVNHQADRILGRRTNSTLTLTDGPDALRFRVQLDKNSQAHKDVYASVQRGDLSECSFAFTDANDSWSDGTDAEGRAVRIRTVTEATLLDVSIVTYPFYGANNATAAEARKFKFGYGKKSSFTAADALAYAIETFRKATRSIIKGRIDAVRSEMGAEDFASLDAHLRCAHEYAELSCAVSGTCRDLMDDDDDTDEELRDCHRLAHAALTIACDKLSQVRMMKATKSGRNRAKK